MLYPEGKDGKKRIGEDMRDLIEDALSLPRGTLDMDPGATAAQPAERASPPAAAQGEPDIQPAAAGMAAETTLERLDQAEKAIVELFRRATDEGKTVIHRVATTVPKADD